jgi:uncharacterized protein (TIGR00255 family)
MIRSMTGFGKASKSVGNRTIEVEIRSLNSKSTDISLKIPSVYRDKEMEIRNFLADRLERGKIDLFITIDGGVADAIRLNKEIAEKYLGELRQLAELTGQKESADYLSLLARIPDLMKAELQPEEAEDWSTVSDLILTAVEELNRYRNQEGNVLSQDLKTRVLNLGSLLDKIETFDKRRIEAKREKINQAISELTDIQIDKNRFEQEMIYYLEKLDFTEEKIRLRNHLEFFINTLSEAGSQGKKLGFIGQEIGREVNTLGSKANDTDIQKLVVMMKDELEKIKEQLANIL